MRPGALKMAVRTRGRSAGSVIVGEVREPAAPSVSPSHLTKSQPAAGVAVTAGAVGALTSFVSETAASYLNACAGMFVEIMKGVSLLVASIPLSAARPADWSVPFCIAWYAALSACLALLRLTNRQVIR